MCASTDPRRTAARLRLVRRRVATLLRTWRFPVYGSSPAALGLVEGWGVEESPGGEHVARVRLRLVADPCAQLALASLLHLHLLALGVDRAAVEVAIERPWRLTDLSEAVRLELGL